MFLFDLHSLMGNGLEVHRRVPGEVCVSVLEAKSSKMRVAPSPRCSAVLVTPSRHETRHMIREARCIGVVFLDAKIRKADSLDRLVELQATSIGSRGKTARVFDDTPHKREQLLHSCDDGHFARFTSKSTGFLDLSAVIATGLVNALLKLVGIPRRQTKYLSVSRHRHGDFVAT